LLEHTFVHIQGIGEKTEKRLWQDGLLTWDLFLNAGKPVFGRERDAFIRRELEKSLKHIHDIRFFEDRFPSEHMWRLYNHFKHSAVFLDIETSGGYMGTDDITVIGLYDGAETQTFVSGINLQEFEAAVAQYDLVVSFNGGCFDIPFIRRAFPNITLPPAHIDLRFFLKRLGYRGGLKRIEKECGLCRDLAIADMDGYDAVRLWRAYQWGDPSALELLVQYNRADIVNLKPLMEMGYRQMRRRLLYRGRQNSGHTAREDRGGGAAM
jgi:uncharacterized protein YprB with RNaseH-like and TPR domain